MRAALLLGLVLAQLMWWDLLDKTRVLLSWRLARRAIDREMPGRAVRLFAIARFAVHLRLLVEVDPETLPDRFVVVSNHQSVIDIIAIIAAFQSRTIRFVAKRELRRGFPAVSRVLRIQRHALISRHGDFATAMREIERLGRSLRSGDGAAIFPEGTRSRDGAVHTFHSGAVRRLLAAAPLPLVVVAVDGGHGVTSLGDLGRMRHGHRYRLRVLEVLPAAQGKRALVEQLRHSENLIRQTVARWREEG